MDENGVESIEELHFFYDAQSRPAFVEFDGEIYRYVHNLQGDIVAIVDAAGNLVVEYKYDAWGKLLSATGTLAATRGKWNPFRYRGYVYDDAMYNEVGVPFDIYRLSCDTGEKSVVLELDSGEYLIDGSRIVVQ